MLLAQQLMHQRCSCRLSLLLLLLLLGLALAASAQPDPHLRKLFAALDKDHDGQVIKSELRSYIKNTDSSYSSSTKLDQAVERAIGRLDSPDVGLGVSWTELEQHLHTLLQDVKVADWVAHGLGLPQYAEAFRSNSITALDLPMLVNDGGMLLQSELKVESPLHRQQLLRAMQRQILGLGSPPGPLQHLQCSVSTSTTSGRQAQRADTDAMPAPEDADSNAHQSAHPTTAAETPGTKSTAAAAVPAAVVCSWLPPADAGQPGMHKYVLQRMDHSAPSAVWQTVAELHDSLSVRHTDVPPKPGVYQYRLAAWNVYGRSPYIVSYDVVVPDQHATPAAATRASKAGGTAATAAGTVLAGIQTVGTASTGTAAQQQQQVSSCGSSSTGDLCRLDGLVVPYHQQQLQDQQLYPQHAASCAGEGLVSGCDPSNESQQECANSFVQQFSSGQGYAPSQQSPNGGVVWLVGLNPDQPWAQGTPATAAGRVAQQRLVESMHAAAAVGAKRGIAASSAGPAGAGPATSSNESSKGSATTARLVALLGSAWHSSMNSWLKAVANTLTAFLLLVLPICVRLLPVHVLTQAAQMLAWGLHFLPAPLRQRLLLRPVVAQQHLGPSLQPQEQQKVSAAPALLQELDGNSGGSRAGTPQRRRATDGALFQQVVHPAAPGASVVGAAGDVAGPAASHSLVVAAAPPTPSSAGGTLNAAAAAGARRRLLPRSVSDFDLVRQARSASPGAASRHQARAVSSSLSSSPVCGGPLTGGLLGASAVRFASGSGSSAAGYGQLVAPPAAAEAAGQGQQGEGADAAAAVGSVHEEVERELQYLLGAGHGSTLPDNKQCSFPGCRQQFGLRHWKATLHRHYCGRCQQAFCAQHTAYSPHGSSGTCGVQSRCLCIDCFYEYTPEYQAFLASRNTLTGKRSRSGPPAAAAAVGSSSSTGGGKSGMLSRLVSHSLSSSQKQLAAAASNGGDSGNSAVSALAPNPAEGQQQQPQQQQGQAAADASADSVQHPTAAAAHDSTGQQTAQPQAAGQVARQRSLAAGATAPSTAYSRGTKSRMLWGRGLTKALGVVRFKHAGDMHAGAASQPETAAAAPAAAARLGACAAAGAAGQEA